MKAIWKFPFTINDYVRIPMPAGAHVLCVGIQDKVPCIWALVEIEAEIANRIFRIYGTGHECNEDRHNYIGTFQTGPFVWHMFDA